MKKWEMIEALVGIKSNICIFDLEPISSEKDEEMVGGAYGESLLERSICKRVIMLQGILT